MVATGRCGKQAVSCYKSTTPVFRLPCIQELISKAKYQVNFTKKAMVELSSKEQWDSLLDSVDTVLLDCDGKWISTNICYKIPI